LDRENTSAHFTFSVALSHAYSSSRAFRIQAALKTFFATCVRKSTAYFTWSGGASGAYPRISIFCHDAFQTFLAEYCSDPATHFTWAGGLPGCERVQNRQSKKQGDGYDVSAHGYLPRRSDIDTGSKVLALEFEWNLCRVTRNPNKCTFCEREGNEFIREQMLESRFPHHGGICENVVWRDRTPSTIDQPPSFKVGKANSVSIEHAETDVRLFG
jgi:hypothetical protein